MLSNMERFRVKVKLEENKLNGIKPSSVAELTKELGYSRYAFYCSSTTRSLPGFEEKVRNWLNNIK